MNAACLSQADNSAKEGGRWVVRCGGDDRLFLETNTAQVQKRQASTES